MIPIHIAGLDKRYDDTVALRDIDLTIEANEVFCLVGPNGAGKSTLIDVVLDYTRPSDGRVRVFGKDPRTDVIDVHRRVGVLPQGFDVYPGLTARQHLDYAIDANDATDDPKAMLDRVALGDVANRRATEFSRGMTQRLGLAMALVGDPELLVLDEPFSGIDPNGMRLVRSIVHEEVDRGASVLLSSHDLSNVREVGTRIGILADGRLVAAGTETELCSSAPLTTVLSTETRIGESQLRDVAALDSVAGIGRRDGSVVVRATAPTAEERVDELLDSVEIRTNNPTLDDVFAHYTLDSSSA